MINGTLTRTETTARVLTCETPAPEDLFATAPVQSVRSARDRVYEEEVYTSFEAAISDRIVAMTHQLRLMEQTKSQSNQKRYIPQMQTGRALKARYGAFSRWMRQRGWLMLGTALMLLLIGFDAMGLLVLHLH